MEQDNAPTDHTLDMSQIEEEGNASANKASFEYSLDPIQEKRQNGESQSDTGKTHEDRKLTTDTESFMKKWLQSVWIKKGSSLHDNLISFLTPVGVDDEEGLEALATSFNEICGKSTPLQGCGAVAKRWARWMDRGIEKGVV